jgi:tmRNA-binding protein
VFPPSVILHFVLLTNNQLALLSVFCSPYHQNTDHHHEKEMKTRNVLAMTKAMTELLMKNQQSTNTTLERVERSNAATID